MKSSGMVIVQQHGSRPELLARIERDRARSPIDVILAHGTGRSRSFTEQELLARIDGVPEWRVGLEEALGLRPLRERHAEAPTASIRIMGLRNYAPIGIAAPPYALVLEWPDHQDDATFWTSRPYSGDNPLYAPAGLFLVPETKTFEECVPLFQRSMQSLEPDLLSTLRSIPRGIALQLLRYWEEQVVTVQQRAKDIHWRERIVYRSAAIVSSVSSALPILKRLRYLIAALEYGVWVEYITKDARGAETVIRGTYDALAEHLTVLAQEELPKYLNVSPSEVLARLSQILGLPIARSRRYEGS